MCINKKKKSSNLYCNRKNSDLKYLWNHENPTPACSRVQKCQIFICEKSPSNSCWRKVTDEIGFLAFISLCSFRVWIQKPLQPYLKEAYLLLQLPAHLASFICIKRHASY